MSGPGGGAVEQDPVRELLRTLPGVVYRCAYDAQWTMQLLSDEIEVVTGFPASSFIGNRDRSFASVIHPDDHDRVAREIDEQLTDHDDFACEYRITRADGTTVWILERGRRVRIGDQPAGLLDGLLFDITDRKRAQEELRASLAEQAAYRAVVEERTNLVRELHDSIGHALSVISLYGGITATQLPGDPEAATATIQTIREVAKDARDDIDRLLGVVGRTPDAPVPRGLADVPLLTQRLRAAGVPVDLVMSGEPGCYPKDLDHTAYRVVQEGLTNVMKHARDASVTVRVEYESAAVTIEVLNDGPSQHARLAAPRQGAVQRKGRGIAGLAQRVHELGGKLTAGTRAQGGFSVTAVLPL